MSPSLPAAARGRMALSTPPSPSSGAVRLYLLYAAASLAVTVLSGVWMRSGLLQRDLLGGFAFPHIVHAHSHIAFFGWTTMALFALVALACGDSLRARWLPVHAHFVGVASVAAFIGFLLDGYNRYTIALSALHVFLWAAFALAVWRPLAAAAPLQRRFYRGALAFLVLAGAGAVAPTVVMVRGIEDPWVGKIALELFLTPFVAGWLLLGVAGAVYGAMRGGRFQRPVFWLTAGGVYPALLLHTTAPPPAEWLVLAGRFGTLLLGLAALLFAIDVLRAAGVAPLVRVAGLAALAKGGAEVLAALGIGLHLIGSPSIVIAYLHLVLLALVTSALLGTALGLAHSRSLAMAHAGGVAVMLAALVGIGWPALLLWLDAVGISVFHLLVLALAGSVVSAAAVLALLAAGVAPLLYPTAPLSDLDLAAGDPTQHLRLQAQRH